MVVLFGTGSLRVNVLQDVLADVCAVHLADHWWQVEASSIASWCAVVVIDALQGSTVFQQLIAFKTRVPSYPLVLVTTKDAENARHLKRVVLEEVLWTCEAPQQVCAVVTGLRGKSHLAGVARELESADHVGRHLRTALVHACTSASPVRSIAVLATAVGRNRCTLAREWRRVVGVRPAVRLEDFLDWVLLLRALEIRAAGRKWSAVATGLDVHPHTLSRIALRVGGASLSVLAGAGLEGLVERFRRDFLSTMLNLAPVTNCDKAIRCASVQKVLVA
jgi:hypothetical protein